MKKMEWLMLGLGGVMWIWTGTVLIEAIYQDVPWVVALESLLLLFWSWWLYGYFGLWKIKKMVAPFFKPLDISPFVCKWPSPQYRVEADGATFYVTRSGRLTKIIEPCIQNPEDHTLVSLRAIIDGDRRIWRADDSAYNAILIREYLDLRPEHIPPEAWEALLRAVLGHE